VGDRDGDHLAFRGEALDWQVWIERGDAPVFRKIVITYKDLEGTPPFGAVFLEWDLDAEVPDELLVLAPPEGAERISMLARLPWARIQGVR
jgi:hypothetical protein